MPIVIFSGFITPTARIVAHGGPRFWNDAILGAASMRYTISGTVVRAECEIQEVNEETLTVLQWWILSIIDGVVDAIAFSLGLGITFVLDKCQQPGKEEEAFGFRDGNLKAECSFTAAEILAISQAEPGILKHIHDLSYSIVRPFETTVCCARAVEGFRHLLAPGVDRKKQWEFLEEHLNLKKSYTDLIKDSSVAPRHGELLPQGTRTIFEVRKRSWVVANRFLAFRKGGNVKLSESDFPTLHCQS